MQPMELSDKCNFSEPLSEEKRVNNVIKNLISHVIQ